MLDLIRKFPRGNIDMPLPGGAAPRGSIVVTGWALDRTGPMSEVRVLVNDEIVRSAELGVKRPDVAAQFRRIPRAIDAGWRAVIDIWDIRQPAKKIVAIARSERSPWREIGRTDIRVDEAAPVIAGRKPRAIFTIAQNESVFLPLWLKHYSRYFDAPDIYVLDHGSVDGSTDGLGAVCKVIPVYRSRSFDHIWLKTTVEQFQSFLLCSYETVLFTEIDEFVVANPAKYAGLGAYIESMMVPLARCTGYNVIQVPGEAALQFERPILAQRGHWVPSPLYCKPLLSRVPLCWMLGFHKALNLADVAPDPDLCLLHLHRVDRAYCLARHRAALERKWNEQDLTQQLGWQNRIVEPAEFDQWFYGGVDLEGGSPQAIPAAYRGAF